MKLHWESKTYCKTYTATHLYDRRDVVGGYEHVNGGGFKPIQGRKIHATELEAKLVVLQRAISRRAKEIQELRAAFDKLRP